MLFIPFEFVPTFLIILVVSFPLCCAILQRFVLHRFKSLFNYCSALFSDLHVCILIDIGNTLFCDYILLRTIKTEMCLWCVCLDQLGTFLL
jgi:hypothetical protein